jgi:hypothetical protein
MRSEMRNEMSSGDAERWRCVVTMILAYRIGGKSEDLCRCGAGKEELEMIYVYVAEISR